jgi:GLPGLI family protein
MKSFYFTVILSFLYFVSNAQQEGVITYQETIKIKIDLPPEYAEMIPKERQRKTTLTFNSKESIYRNLKEEANVAREIEANSASGGMRMRFQGRNENNETYKNLELGSTIEKQEFFGREFRIIGEEKIAWKMSGEQKKIGEYVCMKASYMRDTIPVMAWFTPQIPISNGPDDLGQLPGMILEVDIDNGKRVIKAIEITLRALTENDIIAAPDKGKEITREEFNKIREEKMAEMREMGGGRGTFIIRGN